MLVIPHPMQLPSIASGKRFSLSLPTGSADALLLARLARGHADAKRVLAVFSADPADTQRLADEIAFFAPTSKPRKPPGDRACTGP